MRSRLMRSSVARANSIVLLALAVSILALGWLAAHAGAPMREPVFSLHVSLGIVAAATLVGQIVLRLAVPPPAPPPYWSNGRAALVGASELAIYLFVFAAIASGAAWGAFSGAPLEFFGHPLPASTLSDRPLAALDGPALAATLNALGLGEATAASAFLAAHRLFALLLAGMIALHLAAGGLARFRERPAPTRALAIPPPEDSPTLGLSSRLRLLGWLQFWPQLAIALASAVLLQFATAGRAFSPGGSGYGDAIYWSLYAFLLLCAATALAFYYTRAARSVARPDYLARHDYSAFWFLSLGLLIGLAGTALSFIGVSLSVSLLIAKTVSQPPGIAITDPSKIIRALDVFVLLVNFVLLLAHFIGTGIAAWLGSEAARVRFRFRFAPPARESRA